MYKIDVIVQQVDAPSDLACKTGHTAPENFRREGAGTPSLPTRFFKVTGFGTDGTYCEPCLIVANWWGKLKREGKVK